MKFGRRQSLVAWDKFLGIIICKINGALLRKIFAIE